MRLILVRHGDAYAGFQGVIGGPTGCAGLTPLGRLQAGALRDYLAESGRVRADVLVSSIIPRAIETAEIIAPGLGIETFDRRCDLCEVHTGQADGLEWSEWSARHGSFDMESEPDRVFAPEGESWNSFHQRVRQMLERVAGEHEGQTVVAVGPGGGGHAAGGGGSGPGGAAPAGRGGPPHNGPPPRGGGPGSRPGGVRPCQQG